MKKTDKKYEIPKGGYLGLLALGDIGLVKWREKRAEMKDVKVKDNRTTKKGDEQKNS